VLDSSEATVGCDGGRGAGPGGLAVKPHFTAKI